jgi:hypothetical protein
MCKNKAILFLNIDFGIFFLTWMFDTNISWAIVKIAPRWFKVFQLGHIIYISKSYPTWF